MKKSTDNKEPQKGIVKDYEKLMRDFYFNPLFQQEWKKRDYYEQYSIYDDNTTCISGIL